MLNVVRSAITPEEMLPAVAQGAIGVERRKDDVIAAAMLATISDLPTTLRVTAERAFLRRLDGSCETPLAGLAELDGENLWLRGEILLPDGSLSVRGERRGLVSDGIEMGRDLAEELLGRAPPEFRELAGINPERTSPPV